MPTVHFEAENRTVEVQEGTTLRQAARQAGVSVYGSVNKILNCRGFGLCGTDRIQVGPRECVSPPTVWEKLQLGDNAQLRLACQVKILGEVKVNTAPAMAYGIEMLDTVKFAALAAIFGLLTLGAVLMMAFEMVGRPMF